MEKIDVKQMLRLNHALSVKHFGVKFVLENDYEIYIVPMNKDYNAERNDKMFEIITEYYKKLGLDAMIDTALMRFSLYR